MIDSLLKVIAELWQEILPFYVIDEYEKGVVLRLGVKQRVVNPGLYLKIPFVDRVISTSVVPTTMPLFPQSITTKDNKNIVVRAVIKYKVADPETFLLKVNDATDAISDATQGIIRDVVSETNYDRCRYKAMENRITKYAAMEAEYWGIHIMAVTITDIGMIRTFRLIKDEASSDI